MPRPGRLHVGTSGWVYSDWAGRFYPKALRQADWFRHYAQTFDTVELNGTFYRLPEAETFAAWSARAPRGFCYAVKFSRFGSHMKRLLDPEGTIGLFLSRAERLGSHFGPILVQLPPRWHVDVARLAAFLDVAPARHRWAIEVRDASWLCDPVYDLLAQHRAALVVHDLLPHHPHVPTTDWMYQRFHGVDYGGHYTHQHLTASARRIVRELEAGHDVYAYFNNDKLAAGVDDALALKRYALKPFAPGARASRART